MILYVGQCFVGVALGTLIVHAIGSHVSHTQAGVAAVLLFIGYTVVWFRGRST